MAAGSRLAAEEVAHGGPTSGGWGTPGDAARPGTSPRELSPGPQEEDQGAGSQAPDRRGRPSAEAVVQLLRTLFSSLRVRETAVGTVRPAPQTVLKMMS